METSKVKELLEFLLPLLVLKEEQVGPWFFPKDKTTSLFCPPKLTLELIDFLPTISNDPQNFLEACRLVDKISSYNDTRKKTNTSKSVEKAFKDSGIL